MKRLLFVTASLCLSAAAFAQPRGDGRGGGGRDRPGSVSGPSSAVYSLTKCRTDLLNSKGQGEMFTAIVLPVGSELPQAACARSVDFLCQSVLQTYLSMDRTYQCRPFAPVAVFGALPLPPMPGGFPGSNGGGMSQPRNGGDLRLECYLRANSYSIMDLTAFVATGNNVKQVVSAYFIDEQQCLKARDQAKANKGAFCQIGFDGRNFTQNTIELNGKVTMGSTFASERQCNDLVSEWARRN